ncbi:CmpA/NrtA family ABC transporter substrate-binding protein [Massilia yuzhufengensis]|uniref:Nitrate/nitrite transport system substrate-binding protein n=1 Tax=Massilia yuzhufengensis TaxID=1164594 RepID=A0A1I1FQP4_9BURK|nr:CmpA/NrtA family ABC transporter substrate-binding protein [Massilia yuzhufengensis]SFC01767.1 nitrate/nitrite transport system substrate-binding protein [Massilia yuzhufengensis]
MAGMESSGAWIAGSDRPEKTTVRIGFMPVADCAPVVMASVLGFDEKYGIRFELSRELSWTGTRDRLVGGGIDAGHVLVGLLYGLQMGIGTPAHQMAVLMNLNQNGQGITLSRALAGKAQDGAALAALLRADKRRPTFGHTFPTGNHAMFLYYWLAAAGLDPFEDCNVVTVPPGQMVSSLAAGHMDGFCAGEPWGQRAVREGAGALAVSSQTIWPNHPGKVLGASAAFAAANPHTCRAMIAALLDTARWLDSSRTNREAAAEVLASPAYVNADRELLQYCLAGRRCGAGDGARGHNGLRFFGGGEATFPWLSDGMWFLTQQRRWGLLRSDPSYRAIAQEVNRLDLYRDAAAMAGVDLPDAPLRSSTLLGGRVWDGSDPAGYAASFMRTD